MSRSQKACGHRYIIQRCMDCEDHLVRVLMDTPALVLTPMSQEGEAIRSWLREHYVIERMNEND